MINYNFFQKKYGKMEINEEKQYCTLKDRKRLFTTDWEIRSWATVQKPK